MSLLKLIQGGDPQLVQRHAEQPLERFDGDGAIPENRKHRCPTAEQVRGKRKRVSEARARAMAAAAPAQTPQGGAKGRKVRRKGGR